VYSPKPDYACGGTIVRAIFGVTSSVTLVKHPQRERRKKLLTSVVSVSDLHEKKNYLDNTMLFPFHCSETFEVELTKVCLKDHC
jgi:hypothetical protein